MQCTDNLDEFIIGVLAARWERCNGVIHAGVPILTESKIPRIMDAHVVHSGMKAPSDRDGRAAAAAASLYLNG